MIKKILLLCALFILIDAVAQFILNNVFAPAVETREPSYHEQFYRYVAVNLNEPDLCKKISPRAAFRRGDGTPNSTPFYKAQCYYDVAVIHDRIDIADLI